MAAMTKSNRLPLVDARQDPRFLKALRTLEEAVQAERFGQIVEADRLYARVVKKNPDYFDALQLYGMFKYRQGDYRTASDLLKRATTIHPRSVPALNNFGIVLCHLKRPADALKAFERALSLDAGDANALNNRGNALMDLKRADAALASFDAAIKLQPNFSNAYINRGRALLKLERYEDALANYDRALSFAPSNAEIHNNRGAVLYQLRRVEEALASLDRAIILDPNLVDAYCNRGSALRDLTRYEEAFADFEKALALKPDSAVAWCGLGGLFNTHRRYEAAYEAYSKALTLDPDQERAAGPRIHAKMQLCDWAGLDVDFATVLSSLRKGKLVGDPFSLLGIPGMPEDYFQCARLFTKSPTDSNSIQTVPRYNHERIRIAYISTDFRSHSVGYLIAGAIEAHDRSRFEINAVSLVSAPEDAMQTRLRGAFERFTDAEGLTDRQIVETIRDHEIDIVVDLNGFTQNSRRLVLAQRPSPIQVSYLGYAGTMGADYVDYIVADQIVLPPEHASFFSEKVAWLPNSYMASDNKRFLPSSTPTRQDCGLPDNAFVFCCFNQTFKITPEVFGIWMHLLRATKDSVLWLSAVNPTAEANLRREAQQRGIGAERLIFAKQIAQTDAHLARQKQADLFLDTLPYNAHTTANEALWVGLPVLTRIGDAFHGRVAASLLKAAGLPEMVTASIEAYQALALELANNPERLFLLKQKLERNRFTAPLFDTKLFTRRLEEAYIAMYERYQAGLTPDHIVVAQ
jgi:protein O-GlcNAc transferase